MFVCFISFYLFVNIDSCCDFESVERRILPCLLLNKVINFTMTSYCIDLWLLYAVMYIIRLSWIEVIVHKSLLSLAEIGGGNKGSCFFIVNIINSKEQCCLISILNGRIRMMKISWGYVNRNRLFLQSERQCCVCLCLGFWVSEFRNSHQYDRKRTSWSGTTSFAKIYVWRVFFCTRARRK